MESKHRYIPPTKHPKPYQSPLWRYLDDITKMVSKDTPWRKIAEVIGEQLNKSIPTPTLYNFYNRYTGRKRPLPRKLRELLGLGEPEEKPHNTRSPRPRLKAKSKDYNGPEKLEVI